MASNSKENSAHRPNILLDPSLRPAPSLLPLHRSHRAPPNSNLPYLLQQVLGFIRLPNQSKLADQALTLSSISSSTHILSNIVEHLLSLLDLSVLILHIDRVVVGEEHRLDIELPHLVKEALGVLDALLVGEQYIEGPQIEPEVIHTGWEWEKRARFGRWSRREGSKDKRRRRPVLLLSS